MRLWLRLCPCKSLTNERGNFSVGASLYSKWDPPGRDTPQGGHHTHHTLHSNLIFNPIFPNSTLRSCVMRVSLLILNPNLTKWFPITTTYAESILDFPMQVKNRIKFPDVNGYKRGGFYAPCLCEYQRKEYYYEVIFLYYNYRNILKSIVLKK